MALRGTMSRSPSYNGASFKDLHADRGRWFYPATSLLLFLWLFSQPSIFCSCTMYDIAIIDVVEGKEPPPTWYISAYLLNDLSLRLFYIKRLVPQSVSYLAMQQASRLSASNVAASVCNYESGNLATTYCPPVHRLLCLRP